MYSITIILISFFLLFQTVNATCSCADGDTVCFQQCVTNGQNCVIDCNGDIDCYHQCILNHWPGQTQPVDMTTPVTTTTTTNTPSTIATTSVVPTTAVVNATTIVGSNNISTTPAVRPISTFSPIPPTSSTAPNQPNNSNSKPFLIPAVAIGVASVTVMVQFFFLARMGAMLFH